MSGHRYFLYSSALSQRARWRALLTMSLGGAGELLFGIGYIANDDVDASDFRPKEKKMWMQHYIYARRDTEDGPLEIIPPQELLWYPFYVQNYYIKPKMWNFRRHSVSTSTSHTNNILSWCSKFNRTSCLIDGVGQSRTIRRCPQLSCLSLVHCVISVVVGPLMTVKSPLRLTMRSIVVFFRFL